MNYIEEMITEKFELSLSRAQAKDLTRETLKFIFKFSSSKQYKDALNNILCDFERVVDITKEVLSDGYLMKNIKLWFFYVVANNVVRKNRQHYAEMFDIADDDIEMLSHYNALSAHFSKIIKYPAMTLSDFEKVVVYALKKSDSFTKKYVYKKMSFIIRTQGLEASDLVGDLKAAAIHSVMFTYPRFQTFEHCLNTVKRTIHNKGVNLMEFYSGSNRSKLIQGESGFTNKAVPLSFAVADETCNEFMACNLQNTEAELDDVIAVKQLIRSYSGKRQQFLKLLLEQDEGFTNYLQENKITKTTNDEYRENCRDFKTYVNHCLDYLGVRREKGEQFIEKLKTKLTG